MNLVRIEGSSSVESAGFADGMIRILYRSGHWKDFPGSAELLAELLAAPSKGRFVRERLGGRPAIAADPRAPLETFDHDDCCSPRLSRAIATGKLAGVDRWQCPKCSVDWVPGPGIGGGRHWAPRVWSTVIR